jgi:hemoglobin-like flavoprotein
MLTDQEISTVKKSWARLRNIDPVVIGDAFYSKLFFERPALRKMFPVEMDAQYKKLVDMLNTIVTRLDQLDELTEEIIAMAKRHEGYGVKPEHYGPVGEALMWTLKVGMGSEWNEELREGWTKCYGVLANAMIGATVQSQGTT